MFIVKFGSKIDSATSQCAQIFNDCMQEREKAKSNDGNQTETRKIDVFPILNMYLESTSEISKRIVW